MRTAKAALYLSLVLGLLVAGVALRRGAYLVFTIPVVTTLGLAGLLAPRAARVELERRVSARRVFAGEEVRVDLHVRNVGREELLLEVRDLVDGGLLVSGSPHALVRVRPGEERSISYVLRFPRRGFYTVGPARAFAGDPLEISRFVVAEAEAERIVVFPAYESLRSLAIRPRRTASILGNIPSRKRGQGLEFHTVREYQPGDEHRRVNWKALARLNRLMVNVMEEERITDVLIVVDSAGSRVLGEAAEAVAEASASAAASLAWLFLREGNRVGLVAYGSGGNWVTPGFGRRQFMRILYYLAGMEDREAMPLAYLVHSLLPYLLKPQAQLLLISPLLEWEVVPLVGELAREYRVSVLSPDPFTMGAWGGEEAAVKILASERRSILIALSRVCPVVEWSLSTPLAGVVRASRRVGGW